MIIMLVTGSLGEKPFLIWDFNPILFSFIYNVNPGLINP
jgi:hypothetical protein